MQYLEPHRFVYLGRAGRISLCNIELCPLDTGQIVVVCSERSDNPGTCVTNSAAQLAAFVCGYWSIEPSQLIWIEHNPARGKGETRIPETWELVTFKCRGERGVSVQFREPDWRPMDSDDWSELGIASLLK